MTGWIGQVPALLLALALLIVPGLPAGLCLRGTRGVVRLGATIGVSLGVLGAAALIAPVLGLRWGLLPVAIVAAVVAVVAVALRVLDRRPAAATTASAARWTAISVTMAALAWVVILVLGIRDPGNPTQLYDGLFHLNAVEFIGRTGDASPLHMTMATPNLDTSFYPTLWHALVSLVVPVAGSVVAATNMVTVAVVALIWPVALATVTIVVFPQRPLAAVWAPLLGLGFSVFPLGFLNWGVLYPNLIGTVLIPILIAVVILSFERDLGAPRRALRILVALAVAGGTALGHPSALLGALALLLPYLLWCAWDAAKGGDRTRRVVVAVLVAVGTVAFVIVWIKANVTTNEWVPTQTIAQALGEVAFLSPVDRSTGLLLGTLAAIGIWRVVRDRRWWILASYALSVGLYLAAAWFPLLGLRSLIVGVWYDDTTRVAALLAIWGLPLAALGGSIVGEWLGRLRRAGRTRVVVAVVALLAVAAATHLVALQHDLRYLRDVSYRFDEQSQGLSPDESVLFERADDDLAPDSLVIGDPLTGAGLLFAYTGHDVVFPHVTGRYGADAALLARYLASGGPEVCDAVERLGVTHALDFGDTVLFQNHYTTYDGLHDLDESPILTEVDRVGDATLYEISGCE
ncbi:DUF6541 family protein [Microbacterium sp.]|uniref:DUF6541 family protein n=1 Tax=Microbacterium sp. TaxID=51671 RepID=UPI003A954962